MNGNFSENILCYNKYIYTHKHTKSSQTFKDVHVILKYGII